MPQLARFPDRPPQNSVVTLSLSKIVASHTGDSTSYGYKEAIFADFHSNNLIGTLPVLITTSYSPSCFFFFNNFFTLSQK